MAKIDRIVKGFLMSIVFSTCLFMTLGSGGSLNPAFGLAQSTYSVALNNREGSTLGNDKAKYMWVYIVMPFIGAILAAVFYLVHVSFAGKSNLKKPENFG